MLFRSMVARSRNGEILTYPVVETVQKDHICHIVKVPADVGEDVSKMVATIAKRAIEAVDGVGIFGIEMFILEDKSTLINELAPRPHNSGHYTIDACITSQYENHLRAILGLSLGPSTMIQPSAVMVNLLGNREGIAQVSGIDRKSTRLNSSHIQKSRMPSSA